MVLRQAQRWGSKFSYLMKLLAYLMNTFDETANILFKLVRTQSTCL